MKDPLSTCDAASCIYMLVMAWLPGDPYDTALRRFGVPAVEFINRYESQAACTDALRAKLAARELPLPEMILKCIELRQD